MWKTSQIPIERGSTSPTIIASPSPLQVRKEATESHESFLTLTIQGITRLFRRELARELAREPVRLPMT